MEIIAQLGSLLGLSFVSGVNLYATVAVVGLCIKHGLVQGLPPELQVLANDAVIFVALFLYVIEFVVDKIPGLDTLWDTLHTIVRPLGGAMLALMQVGQASPALEVIVFMLGASLASAAHMTKAGTRLLVQASPEPFSNMALSVGEDIFAVGYAYVSLAHPRWTFFTTIVLLVLLLVFFPMLARHLVMLVKAFFHRIFSAFGSGGASAGAPSLPYHIDRIYSGEAADAEEVHWAGPAYASRVPGVPRACRVHVVLTSLALRIYYRRLFRWQNKSMPRQNMHRVRLYPGRLLSKLVVAGSGETWILSLYSRMANTLPAPWMEWHEPNEKIDH
ncbi:DUF4126 domain-containing protein [Desulfacinum hydrothermale]|nr:DUF4126 domain-containing protein [Desulfacinum hydrothermale]